MKHADYFDNFMTSTVNLSKFKLERLEKNVEDLFSALKGDTEFGAKVISKKRQGSWAQRTIIEPQNGKEFDGDIMVRLRANSEWADNPSAYTNALYNALVRVIKGRDITRKARCVRVHYGAMHVDVVPYVVLDDGSEAIINRDTNEFEATNPAAFTTWMREQDDIAHGNLRKVIRMMKYLRDHKNSFTGTRSIILTTLLGERVSAAKEIWTPGAYGDLPTALLTIVTDLDDWLLHQFSKPRVDDPSGTGLNFDHRWNDESFHYFKARLKVHAAQIREACEEEDFDKSVKKWQALFGEDFKAPKPATPAKFGSTVGGASTGRAG